MIDYQTRAEMYALLLGTFVDDSNLEMIWVCVELMNGAPFFSGSGRRSSRAEIRHERQCELLASRLPTF